MRLLIPLLLFSGVCYAQADSVFSLISRRSDLVLSDNVRLNRMARENARHLIIAYKNSAEDFQQVLDSLDDSWYSDMDVYISESFEDAINYIETDMEGYYLIHKGRVVINVSVVYDLCFVSIYCVP